MAEGPLDGMKRGGDEIYRFFRACADWPEMIEPDQAISVEVRQVHPLRHERVRSMRRHVHVLIPGP